jgi:Putative adhesin
MPTFDTPEPISVTLEVGVGDIRIVAGDHTNTIVEVRPTDRAKNGDVSAAEQTHVEYAGGRLQIRAPKGWRRYTPLGGGESIDVQIDLPAGSNVQGEAGLAAFRCTGRLGECRFKTGLGEIRLDEAGLAQLSTGGGDIIVDQVADHAEFHTGTGAVRVGSIGGSAVVKNGNGDTWIGEATGELRVKAGNGKIAVDQAHAAVTVKTANGDVRVAEVSRGAVVAQTACGKVDIGVLDGVAAWLDLYTHYGNVRNDLSAIERSEPGEATVEVRARSSFGDIAVRRSSPFANDSGRDKA